MNDIDKPTRRMSSFSNVDEIMDWLHHHDVYHGRKEIQRMWDARQYRLDHPEKYSHEINYKFSIVKIRKSDRNNTLAIERQVFDKTTGRYSNQEDENEESN